MTSLTSGMDAALSASAVLMFCAVEIGELRLLEGPSQVTFGGKTFLGRDPTFGVLGGVETVTDGVDGEAPEIVITLLPPTMTAIADLASPAAQGRAVRVWIGALNMVTGAVVPDPMLVFVGEVDVPTLTGDETNRALQYTVTSVFERFFEIDEGARLNNTFHQLAWPAELGFQYVTEVQKKLPWGSEGTARPVAVQDVTS